MTHRPSVVSFRGRWRLIKVKGGGNLSNTDLNNSVLFNPRLKGANLQKVNVAKADFVRGSEPIPASPDAWSILI